MALGKAVNERTVRPVGKAATETLASGLTPIPRWGYPEEIGRAVAAIARGDLPFSTGEVINVEGGYHLRSLNEES